VLLRLQHGAAVEAVDAQTGTIRWIWTFRSTKQTPEGPNDDGVVFTAVSPSGGFLVGASIAAPAVDNYVKFDEFGRIIFGRRIDSSFFTLPTFADSFLLQPLNGLGASLVYTMDEYRLDSGREVGAVRGAARVISKRGKNVLVLLDPGDRPSAFLGLDVGEIDLVHANLVTQHYYAPDFAENYRRFVVDDANGGAYSQLVPVADDRYIYIAVVSRLYRYPRSEPESQPLLVSTDGTLLAGPIDGTLYLTRASGVWSVRPQSRFIEERQVVASRSDAVTMTTSGHTGFVVFKDGLVRGFDLGDGHRTFESRVACLPSSITANAAMVYVVCSVPAWRVTAFKR